MRLRIVILLALITPAFSQSNGEHWVATWATAQELYRAGGGRGAAPPAAPTQNPPAPTPPPPATGPQRRFGIPAPLTGLNNQTIRMIAHTSLGGHSVRIRLSNALGAGTVAIGSAHIAVVGKEAGKDDATVPGTDRILTFSGRASPLMYAGETLISDPVSLDLAPLAHVAVSLYIPGQTATPTSHRFALHTTYISKEGDFTSQQTVENAGTRESYYWLAGIDVLAPAAVATLVTFGDSITDGDQSTLGTDGMWPAVLAARLQSNKATANIAVVNAGIAGNRVLGDNSSGLVRLYHDALSQPGVKWMSVLEGINDITGGSRGLPGAPVITADTLIAAYKQMIAAAHQYGIKVIGCTITPYGGSNVYNDYGEGVRSAVNEWIRNGKGFDAVVDFDAAVRDPSDPKRFRPEVDSPDMLHPSNPGYKLMGEAFAAAFTKAVGAASRATTRSRP